MKRDNWEAFANEVTKLASNYGITADWDLDETHGYYRLETSMAEPTYKDYNDSEEITFDYLVEG